MNTHKRTMIIINVVGGVAVLGSYAYGLATHPDTRQDLWGGVPNALMQLYTGSMLAATAGYFAFTGFLLLSVEPNESRFARRYGFGLVNVLYATILATAALWMPLTFRMLEQPSTGLWIAIRLVLALTGAGSLALLGALLTLTPRRPGLGYALAVAGLAAFSFQTAVLDALIWPAYF